MTIRLQTLQCGECGSHALERIGPNQYRCTHCGSVSLVEDDVAQRLDRMLDQLKDAAADRLATDQRARSLRMRRTITAAALGAAATLAATGLYVGLRTSGTTGVNFAPDRQAIAADRLIVSTPREVLLGSGGPMARPRVLVTVRNETGRPLEQASLEAVFQDESGAPLAPTGGSLPINVLAPGETVPVLIDPPAGDRAATPRSIAPRPLRAPYRLVEGPALRFDRVRLVQEGTSLRMVGRLVNPRKDVALTAIDVLAVVYDERGEPAGTGRGYVVPVDLPPGGTAFVNAPVERWVRSGTPIVAWDYRIGYHVAEADRGRAAVVAPDRVVRIAAGPEQVEPALRMTAEDLLAPDDQRFDTARLALLPLVPAFTSIRQRTYLTEMVNRSTDTIAVAPVAAVSRIDGAGRQDAPVTVAGPQFLYPGERFPVRMDPGRAGRIDDLRIAWKPARRAPLPGPRPPLDIRIAGTRAETAGVLLNFSQRFVYKTVAVAGTVRNPGDRAIRAPQVWISLRDAEGRLTGFEQVRDLTPLAPGERQPFSVDVEQQGSDFATVESFHDALP